METTTTYMENSESVWTLAASAGAGGLILVSLISVVLSIIIVVAVQKKKAKCEPDCCTMNETVVNMSVGIHSSKNTCFTQSYR